MTYVPHSDSSSTPRLLRGRRREALLDAASERDLLIRARAGDGQAVEKLVTSHLQLVWKIARSFRRPDLSPDDLVSEGVLGLLEAIRRFDLARENRFNTYAEWWIRARLVRFAVDLRPLVPLPSTRNMRRARRMLDRTSRALAQDLGRVPTHEELANALGVTPEEVALVEHGAMSRFVSLGATDDGFVREAADEGPSPEQIACDADDVRCKRNRIAEALGSLTEREREVLERRVLDDDRASLSEVGKEYGVSRERVRQIQVRAESKLRVQLLDVA